MKPITLRSRQSGVSLLEALLGILIFSVGILALVALQSISVKATTESKFRADAGFLASQLIAQMWTDVNAVKSGDFALNDSGTNCAFSGGPKTGKTATWLAEVQTTLPGSTAASVQVLNPTNPANIQGLVTINICWLPPGADGWRQFSTVTHVNM